VISRVICVYVSKGRGNINEHGNLRMSSMDCTCACRY
jgi:hypothetical protein